MDHVAPARGSADFDCPICGVCTHQQWRPFVVGYSSKGNGGGVAWWGIGREAEGFAMSFCAHCRRPTLWYGDEPIWPPAAGGPLPAEYMPADVLADFEEARRVLAASPRSAAALLRLALQKLCRELGQPGESLHEDVTELMRWRSPVTVQRALEVVGAAGGGEIAPGKLDLRDDRSTALALFDIVNTVVHNMIAEPAQWRIS